MNKLNKISGELQPVHYKALAFLLSVFAMVMIVTSGRIFAYAYAYPRKNNGSMFLYFTDADGTKSEYEIYINFGDEFKKHNIASEEEGGSNWDYKNISYTVTTVYGDDSKKPTVIFNFVGNDKPDQTGHYRNVTIQFLIPRTTGADKLNDGYCKNYLNGHSITDESGSGDIFGNKHSDYYITGFTASIQELGIAVYGSEEWDNNSDMSTTSNVEVYTSALYNTYSVTWDGNGGTLIDDTGRDTWNDDYSDGTTTYDKYTKEYKYNTIYDFFKAKKSYTVSYDGNGGTVDYGNDDTEDTSKYTTAAATFNGWDEQLDSDTYRGWINNSSWEDPDSKVKYDYSKGSYNWAAYLNKYPDLIAAIRKTYNKNYDIYEPIWAIHHYNESGRSEGRDFSGTSYYDAEKAFLNLTAKANDTVYMKANYTNGSVTLPKGQKDSVTSADGSTRTDYTFKGWYTEKECKNRAGGAGDFYTPSDNITLYAGFDEKVVPLTVKQEIYVRYENTDGTYTEYSEWLNRTVPIGSTISEDWNTLDTAAWIKPDAINYTVTEDKKTYVDIKRHKYTVTYDYRTNGGTYAAKENEQVYYGKDADLSVKAQKNGWTHTGWNTDSNANAGYSSLTVTGNITVYATYRKDITVTFTDFGNVKTQNLALYNRQEYVEINVPEMTPYSGWGNVSDITAEGYSNGENISQEYISECIKTGDVLRISENMSYYAVCSAKATLSYVLNNGSANDTTKDITHTVYISASAPQEVTGVQVQLGESVKEKYSEAGYIHSYIFAVWAENSEDSDVKYSCNAQYLLKENTVMYAIWNETVTPITYYIAFDGNAGETVKNVPQTITAVYDTPVTLTVDKPDRTGLVFLSWNTRADGSGTEIAPGDTAINLSMVDGDTVTLYAQWRRREFVTVKSSNTCWSDYLIKRTMGDDDWYNTVGCMSIRELQEYPDELCEAVWHIDKYGNITQVK
jgi:uncharacterized repeat protein (TIGR02543 family)